MYDKKLALIYIFNFELITPLHLAKDEQNDHLKIKTMSDKIF